MWLLNSKTIELNLYYDNKIPNYAILSHAWGENEVSLQQINGSRSEIQNHAGYIKIQKCCQQAATNGFEHVWIDTCCIDKTNSAELSEAINSMYNWYRNATECYVYLADVTSVEDLVTSRWFTRGWTLQELLAPESAVFFNKNWQEIGTKACLAKEISAITKIPTWVLLGQDSEEDEGFSVAQVMSWAAKRQTTRKEDIGYCLLGIFGVNMPMIYGEGENAFLRLQHEIIKGSTDQSLFAWTRESRFMPPLSGGFAQSPADFVRCGRVVRVKNNEREFSLTNKGLRIEVDLVPPLPKEEFFTAFLNCKDNDQGLGGDRRLGIFLKKVSDDQYVRAKPRKIQEYLFAPVKAKQTTTILITGSSAASTGIPRWSGDFKTKIFTPSYNGCRGHGCLLVDSLAYGAIGDHKDAVFLARSGAFALKFVHESKPGVQFLVVYGTANFHVWADIETMFDNESLREVLWSYFDKNTTTQTTSTRERQPRRYQVRESLRDRITTLLQDGYIANVALKKAIVSGRAQYLVNISIT